MDKNYENISSNAIISPEVKSVINVPNKTQNQFARSQDGVIINNESNTTLLNIVTQHRLNIEILIRNKTLNGEFTNNLTNITVGTDIEYKIILTNVAQDKEILYNISVNLNLKTLFLEMRGKGVITLGTIVQSFEGITWNNISLAFGETATAIFTIRILSIRSGINDALTVIGDYSLLQNGSDKISLQNIKLPTMTFTYTEELMAIKSQQINAKLDIGYITDSLDIINGEVIYYMIKVKNVSDKDILYNIKIIDVLDNNLSCIQNSITFGGKWDSAGSTIVNGKNVGGTVEWNIDSLYDEAKLYFSAYIVANS